MVSNNLSERLHASLPLNKIKKNALNKRLFTQHCLQNYEDYRCLLLNTEVHWLFKSACLDRFYALIDTVLNFLESKDNDLRLNLIH